MFKMNIPIVRPDFEYIYQMSKTKWFAIITLITVGIIACLCGVIIFFSHGSQNIQKTYYIPLSPKTDWFGAGKVCHGLGMKVVSIQAPEEQDLILKAINASGIKEDFWTSGTKMGNENQFYWFETGTNLKFTHWNVGEPNEHPFFPEPEECIQLRFEADLKWNDIACTYKYHVICETYTSF